MAKEIFYYENDNTIRLLGLADSVTGVKQDGKTVKVTLTDNTGTEVTNQVWPITMTAEGGGTGNYSALLKDDLGVTLNKEYFAKIEVFETTDLQATFNVRVKVIKRGDR